MIGERRLATLTVILVAYPTILLSATKVNTSSNADDAHLVAGRDGQCIVTFFDSVLGDAIVRLDAHGNVVYGPAAIEIVPSRVITSYSIAWNGMSVGWADNERDALGAEEEIWFHLMDIDGRLASTPVYVSPASAAKEPCCPYLTWGEGEFLVGYESESANGVSKSLAMRRVSAAGSLLGPEISVMSAGAGGAVNNIRVARTRSQLFAAWYQYEGNPNWIAGAMFDLGGNMVGMPTTYGQETWPRSIALAGLGTLGDAIALFYFRSEYFSGTNEPLQMIHLDSVGAIVLGPVQVGESRPPIGSSGAMQSPQGFAGTVLHVEPTDANGQLYVRHLSTDGALGSISLPFTSAPANTSWYGGNLAYVDGRYGIAWNDNREQAPNQVFDVYFDVMPGYDLLVAGAGADPAASPQVKLLQPDSPTAAAVTINAYGAAGYGANVAAGDVDGDQAEELLTGPGPGAVYGPQVRGFEWQGQPKPKIDFYAYGTLRYGVRPAGGDIDHDGYAEILSTPGPGAVFGPHVRAFNFDNVQVVPKPGVSFYAYATLKYGASSTSGDVDGDGYAEVLTGPGPGAVFAAQLRGFDHDGSGIRPISKINVMVYPAATHGLHVAAGDTDWDDIAEIGCGAGPGPANDSRVVVYDYDGAALKEMPGSRFESFASALGGTTVSFCQWFDRDLQRELVVTRGPVPASASEVRAFDDSARGFAFLTSFDPYPATNYGTTLTSLHPGF